LLEFQRDQIKKRQYLVRYTRHGYSEEASNSRVKFFLDKDDIRNSALEPIAYKDFRELARKSRKGNEKLKIFPTLPDLSKEPGRHDRDKNIIGAVVGFDAERGILEIELDSKKADRPKNGTYKLPPDGYLFFEAGGDIAQIDSQQRALDILKQGRATNPRLGDFFFDARKARPIEAIKKLSPADLLLGTCNNGQIAAIEAALSAPDLLLIQGPPGTGKTTVIAEICYQVALRGGRTLIASQSNLAVDNALGRIIHHPRVRALRKGNLETIDDEGLDYTEERVVQKWLSNTATDCRTRLEKRRQNIVHLRRLLSEKEHFSQYHASEVAHDNKLLLLRHKYEVLNQKISEITANIASDKEETQKYVSLQQTLAALLAGEISRNRPETNAILQNAFQYLFADAAGKQRFKNQIEDGLKIVQQADLTPPNVHLLMNLVWLKATIHTHNAAWNKSIQLIGQIEDTKVSLNQLAHEQKELTCSIRNLQKQAQNLAARIEALSGTLQELTSELWQLQRAMAALNVLPQNGAGSIASPLQEFFNTEFARQSTGWRQFSRLKIEAVFPQEVVTALQRDASTTFLRDWLSAEKDLYESIQKAISEYRTYRLMCDWLDLCWKNFQEELLEFPEINQEPMPPGGYISRSIPQDNASFNQLISCIQYNLENITKSHRRSNGFMGVFSRGKEIAEAQKLSLETRELFNVAYKSKQSISGYMAAAQASSLANIAAQLRSSLQQWLEKQQNKVKENYRFASLEKDQREAEYKQILQQCAEREDQLTTSKGAFDFSIQHLNSTFLELSRCASIPEALRRVAQEGTSSTTNKLSFIEESRTICQQWVSDIQHFEMLVNELWSELQVASEKVQQRLAETREGLEQQMRKLNELTSQRVSLEVLLQHDPPELLHERQWWNDFWKTIPQYLRPLEPLEGLIALSLLEAVEKQFSAWASELAKEEYLAQRYDRLIDEWVANLCSLSDEEKRGLQEVYIQNANVIGITCGQAPRLTPRELKTFALFDTIIIDEVSKATAPELLLPAIKGKKLILIGDRHQLPPMIDDKTLVQIAEETGQDREVYDFLLRSYFKERYDEAPDTIKRMLSVQYRMHPDIMAAINQFYEHELPLECGLNQPDIQRDHQLEASLVGRNKHLIWVEMPLASAPARKQRSRTILVKNKTSEQEVFPPYQSRYDNFRDEKDGTSYRNLREVEIIEKICEEFQRVWALKRAAGNQLKKEIGVITFYAAQEKLLKERLLNRFNALDIRIGSVDRFQGMERAVVIVSMVRNNSEGDIGFARRDERINVAFSRAQELLVIVGCRQLFCVTARHDEAVERYSHVAKVIEDRGDFIDVSCI
jgi:DNA polymerase III delta prime subunit